MNETLRVVLAGCGRISGAWLRSAGDIAGVEVVGLVDVREEAARARADEFGLQAAVVGVELETILARTRPDIVFNCTTPAAHLDVTLAAFRHGCHVLGEKPLGDSLGAARRMVEAADAAGKLFSVTQNRRYNRHVRRLRSLVASNALGPLTTVANDFFRSVRFPGFRMHLAHMQLLELAIHHFDIARCITGADPISVYCKEWNPSGSYYDQDAAAIAIFEMTGGIVYTYCGSCVAEGLDTDNEGAWRLIGQRGSATWDSYERIVAQTLAESGFRSTYHDLAVPPAEADGKTNGHADIMREFIHCVRTGTIPETVARDNIKSLAMVAGAVESAERGRLVDIHC